MPIRILKKDKNKSDPKKRFDPRTGEETNKPGGKGPRTILKPQAQVPPERQMRTGGRLRIGTYQNPTSERSKESIDNYVRGMRKNRSFQYKKNDRGKIIKIELKTGGLSPKQKAIASKAPPPDKIDGKDFAVLKAEKAKGRGMGLQDESVKPGKVMKARTGKMVPLKKDPTKPISSVAPKVTDALKKKKLPGRIGTALGIGSMLVPAAYAAAKQYKDYKSAKNRDKAKVKKYSKGGDLRLDYIDRQTRLNEKATGKKNYIAESKKTRREEYGAAKDRYPNKTDKLRSVAKNVGRALTPSFAAAKSVYDKLSKSSAEKYSVGGGADLGKKGIIKGINANLQDKAERRLNVPDRTDIKKQKTSVTKLKEQARRSRLETMKDRQTGRPVYERMGGGMMQRPMGYKKGVMVKARGCKLGRTRPTKIT